MRSSLAFRGRKQRRGLLPPLGSRPLLQRFLLLVAASRPFPGSSSFILLVLVERLFASFLGLLGAKGWIFAAVYEGRLRSWGAAAGLFSHSTARWRRQD